MLPMSVYRRLLPIPCAGAYVPAHLEQAGRRLLPIPCAGAYVPAHLEQAGASIDTHVGMGSCTSMDTRLNQKRIVCAVVVAMMADDDDHSSS